MYMTRANDAGLRKRRTPLEASLQSRLTQAPPDCQAPSRRISFGPNFAL